MIRLNALFDYIDNPKFQTKLKSINLVICIISFIYIIILINTNSVNNISLSKFNFFEVIILFPIYVLTGITWVKFSIKNTSIVNYQIFWDWSLSNLGKYLPGGFGILTIRLNQNNESNSKKVIFGLIEEQFLLPLISIPALLLSMRFIESNYLNLIITFILILFLYIFKKIYFLNKTISKSSILNYPFSIGTILLGNYFFTFLIFFNFYGDEYLKYAFIYLISSYVGMFFVGVPAGFGVRESIFLLLMGSDINLSDQIEILLYIRLLHLVMDLLFGMVGFIFKNKRAV